MGANIGPINLIAPGLLGLLQLKQFGKNPDELAGVVQGTIELRDWYMQARIEDEVSLFGSTPQKLLATASPGLGIFTAGGVNCTVPNNQAWYVYQLNVAANLLAAETIRFAPALQRAPTGQQFQIGPDVADVVTVRARTISAEILAPFWVRQGDTFGVLTFDDLTAANITVSLFLRAVRIPI